MTAVAGAACISSSAVVMQLAGSSASLTALARCAFALPVLGLLAWRERRRGAAAMTARSRWLARVVFGLGVAVLYAVYILMLRQATANRAPTGRERAPVVAPLLEATIGATFGAAVLGLVLRDFRLGPAWPALGWLLLLALTSQVLGWLLITMSMPGLPAWLVGVLLLVQPAGSLALSAVFLGERPSWPQLVGVAVMLAGVLIAASGQRSAGRPRAAPRVSQKVAGL